jgi:undecaprenyl diphosphate synthase
MYKENYEELHFLKRLINRFQADEFFNDVKFSFVGDWTELNGLQDAVKELIVEEREEISLNLNLFVNYSSREEIIDAGRIIAKKVIKEKLDSDFVNTSAFEELMKGSGPDIALIIFFNNNAFNDFIGFKALRAKFHYIEKSFLNFSEDDVHEALERVGLAKKI